MARRRFGFMAVVLASIVVSKMIFASHPIDPDTPTDELFRLLGDGKLRSAAAELLVIRNGIDGELRRRVHEAEGTRRDSAVILAARSRAGRDELSQILLRGDESARAAAAFALAAAGNDAVSSIEEGLPETLDDASWETLKIAFEAAELSGSRTSDLSYPELVAARRDEDRKWWKMSDAWALAPALYSRWDGEEVCAMPLADVLASLAALDRGTAVIHGWQERFEKLISVTDGMGDSSVMACIGRLGPRAEVLWPLPVDALRHSPDVGLRGYAAHALGEIGMKTDEVIAALLEGMSDENVGVRTHSARSAGRLRLQDDRVDAALEKLAADGHEAAAWALKEIRRHRR